MADAENLLLSLLTALGLGLMVGAVRERQEGAAMAGIRTHALVAVLAAVAIALHLGVLLVMLLALSGLVLIGYRQTSASDPGMTGEVNLLLTALLGALTHEHVRLAAGAGVVVAALLYAKAPLHRFTRELLSERELHDGLVLLAAALVILPLMPDHKVGPYGSLNPSLLWTLAVLVMAISTLGHVALRVVGNRWGLAVAGFFAGYVSSTAAVAGFGQRVRENAFLLRPAVGAAMLASLASLSLLVPVVLAVAPGLLPILAPELGAAGVVLAAGGLLGLRRGQADDTPVPTAGARMFRLSQALGFVAIISVVLVLSAAMNAWFGAQGALIAALTASLAELHAASATLAQLYLGGIVDVGQARWGMLGILAASSMAKSIVAIVSGGRAYGLRVAIGLLAMLLAVTGVLLILPWFG